MKKYALLVAIFKFHIQTAQVSSKHACFMQQMRVLLHVNLTFVIAMQICHDFVRLWQAHV